MKRGGPLKRNKPLRRTGRLNPISSRRRKRDANYAAIKEAVRERCAGVCEVRTSPDCTWRFADVHHIAGRGGADPHRMDNLLGVCRACHDLIHDQPEWARKWGYMKTRHGDVA